MPFICTNFLDEHKIKYKYVPFMQGAMVEIFDSTWKGSCGALSHDWLYRKLSHSDIFTVATYEITNPLLPHVVITGNNDPIKSDDIPKLKSLISYAHGNIEFNITQMEIDNNRDIPKLLSIDNFLNHIKTEQYACGILSAGRLSFYIKTGFPFKKMTEHDSSHALAFIKKGDAISFYDANNGEITFERFSDFCEWFRLENTIGVLRYLINDPELFNSEKKPAFTELFSALEIDKPKSNLTPQDSAEKKLSKKIAKIKNNSHAQQKKIFDYKVYDYQLSFFVSPVCVNMIESEKYYEISKDWILYNTNLNPTNCFDKSTITTKFYNHMQNMYRKNEKWEKTLFIFYQGNLYYALFKSDSNASIEFNEAGFNSVKEKNDLSKLLLNYPAIITGPFKPELVQCLASVLGSEMECMKTNCI